MKKLNKKDIIKKRIAERHKNLVFVKDNLNLKLKKTKESMNETQRRMDMRISNINAIEKNETQIQKISNEIRLINLENLKLSYDICVIITTYNRDVFLKNLLDDILKNKNIYKILIIVFDDASEISYDLSNYDVEYIKYSNNHGKKKYWKLITDTMQICKEVDSKYFIYLPDDVRLVDDFFTKSISLYENIIDNDKVCLSLLLTQQQIGKPNWTKFNPIEMDSVYKTQWCDLCFISEKKFFNVLGYEVNEIPLTRWNNKRTKINREFLSSGVGENLSRRIYNSGFNMYHVKNSLVTHGDHDSIMNYELRKKQKLTT